MHLIFKKHHTYQNVISAYKYLGSENSIYVTQRYIEEFRCHFVLTNYPFDTQVHLIIFTNTLLRVNKIILQQYLKRSGIVVFLFINIPIFWVNDF